MAVRIIAIVLLVSGVSGCDKFRAFLAARNLGSGQPRESSRQSDVASSFVTQLMLTARKRANIHLALKTSSLSFSARFRSPLSVTSSGTMCSLIRALTIGSMSLPRSLVRASIKVPIPVGNMWTTMVSETSNHSMKQRPHLEISSACLPRHPAVAYLYFVRPYGGEYERFFENR